MKYKVTHTCGHCETVVLTGPESARQSRIKWLEARPCNECMEKEVNEKLRKASEEMGLPELRGSKKQIDWAVQIRHEAIEGLKSLKVKDIKLVGKEEDVTAALAWVAAKTSASWWIERRECNSKGFLRKVLDEMAEEAIETLPEAMEAKAEMVTMEPERKATSTVCTVETISGVVQVRSDKDFTVIKARKERKKSGRSLVKSLRLAGISWRI